MLSDVMEDYLKAIYTLEREEGAPVRTSDIAASLDVTPPTVTSMLDKLEERGLVDREKYKGAELTEEGEAVALEVLRHHRLLEAYLAEHLDYDWSEVHEEADTLEHHISEAFEERVASALGDPAVDPHGDPIPTPDLEPLPGDDTARLTDAEEGDVVVVSRVSDRDDEHLSYLADAGVKPGAILTVVEVTPIDMLTVEVNGRPDAPAGSSEGRPDAAGTSEGRPDAPAESGSERVHLPTAIAAQIRVQPRTEATA
ncbi:metal-dependent transcriptional regulator [Halocalculus aciditolerans]|uniref:DtxR family transcriptional regulator n=1 Tax=Halocalculus aciditolerans TaxID=1383812 RepID=A0A830FJ97_9EURY|nr:metal-dependent transcriptional regulator [Halocalculus aciditolerans]GGL61612.1 DtxR family transcriptional regulator [Halocalculus aciditolerans]